MKIHTYQCDNCKAIHTAAGVNSLVSSPDLFNQNVNWKFVTVDEKNPGKVHVCFQCIAECVTAPARMQYEVSNKGRHPQSIEDEYRQAFAQGLLKRLEK